MNNIGVYQEADAVKRPIKAICSQFDLTKALYTSKIFAKVSLTPSAKLFLWALCSHFNPKKATMFPSQATVADKLGISEKSAERAVKELKEQGLVTYTTKRVNHYVFSRKFFTLIGMSVCERQNVGENVRQNVGETNKENKKNNKDFSFSFYKEGAQSSTTRREKPYSAPLGQYGGKAVPSVEETQALIEERRKIKELNFNPLDYNREDALRWLKIAPDFWLRKSTIAKSLVKKYQFQEFKYLLQE